MTHKIFDIPQDIWMLILAGFDDQELAQVSLVSKQFVSIASYFKKSLKISDENLPLVTRVLSRFQNLETIIIRTHPVPYHVDLLEQISCSGVDRQSRKCLKRLDLRPSSNFSYKDLISVVDLFPWLEEISFPPLVYSSEDFFSQDLLPKLTELKKVYFKRSCPFLSDESLVSLSSNCVKLEEIDIKHCKNIGEETIGFMMRHSSKLTTLKLPKLKKSNDPYNDPLCIQNAIICANNLNTISLHTMNISEELMFNIRKLNPRLRYLQIRFARDESNNRIVKSNSFLRLFQVCSSIEHLCLKKNKYLSDDFVANICQCLAKLTTIDLKYSHLKSAGFFLLANNCPSLEEIKASYTNIGLGEISRRSIQKHKKIRRLILVGNINLDDRTLRYILYVCPKLEFLNVNSCTRLTEQGIGKILKNCGLLTYLNIGFIPNVSDVFGSYFKGKSKRRALKVLKAEETSLNDKTLCEIGKICNSLEYLNISSCKYVTNIGVIDVVRNCKKLKTINLYSCGNVSDDIIDHLVPPIPSEEQNHLWKNGCTIM